MGEQAILIINHGNFEKDFLGSIVDSVTREYHFPVSVKESHMDLSEFFDPMRRQYNGNRLMTEDNNRNFSRFMESVFNHYQAEVLVETVLWVFRAYRSHGFQTTYWPANLNTWIEILKKEMSEKAFEAIYFFING